MATENEKAVEAAIQTAKLVYPRLTPAHIDDVVNGSRVDYHVFPGTTLTVCCITLPNGYSVIGESAAASPENFNETIGKRVAFDRARDKIWGLEGYLLRQALYDHEQEVEKDQG